MMRSAWLILVAVSFAALACGKYGAPVRTSPVRAAPAAAASPAPTPTPDPVAPAAEPDEEEPAP